PWPQRPRPQRPQPQRPQPQRPWRAGRLLPHLVWVALAVALFWLTLRAVNMGEVWDRLRHLQPGQIALLLLVNVAVLATFSARWWLLLFAQGYRVPYHHLMAYRLATFAVSYFTPGPHFGGEPLQVYLVTSRHKTPVSVAIAAVVVDKVLEMTANFTFLTLGVLFVVRSQVLPGVSEAQLLLTSLGLLLLPLSLLVAILMGWHPLSALFALLERAWRWFARQRGMTPAPLAATAFVRAVRQSEDQSITLCRDHPLILMLAVGASVLSWAAIVGEFWLMAAVLGLDLTLPETIAALLAARVAILLPLPAAVGALEASQALAMQLLGQSPAAGVSLSFLIRGRDMLLGLVGLALAGVLVWGRKKNQEMERLEIENLG
ncbi:MAG: flippase-like domain-containing protein, partial [Caldilineaceae bacterium]|nr:flippase-like domain-containing protein [Caldilineaceae bacterium]